MKYLTISVSYDCTSNELNVIDSTPKIIDEDLKLGTNELPIDGFTHELNGLSYCPILESAVSV